MIYEMRTYDIKPGSVAEAEKRFGAAYEERKEHSELVAFWHTALGPLNQVVYVWKYQSLADRARVRAAAGKSPNWPPGLAQFSVAQRSEILIPAPSSPELKPGKIGTVIAALVLVGAATGACAQNTFPTKPVRILTTEAGGSSDTYVRIIAPAVTNRWGKQVIVDNRPGIIAIETLIRAQPDGYSLLCFASALWIGPMMGRGTYDPFRDVMPITLALSAPLVLAVNASLPAKSVSELIALAKARPGTLSYGSGGQGSGLHLAGELFKSMAGVDILRVPYSSASPATTATITGEVSMIFATVSAVGQHVKSGRLRLLGVGSLKSSLLVPNLPTIASTVPGFDAMLIQGFFAPAKTPPALITKLQRDITAALAEPEVRDKFLVVGAETVGSAPQELSKAMKLDVARYSNILKAGGIKTE